MAKDKPKPIDPEIVRQALADYPDFPNLPQIVSTGVAATIASPYMYPQWLRAAGENPRTTPRNELLGHYITVPAQGYLAAGICYTDHANGLDDQDMRLLDIAHNTLEAASPREFARRFPKFGEYHRGAQRQFFDQLSREGADRGNDQSRSSRERAGLR